jgi:S1-C subfamily serine protease
LEAAPAPAPLLDDIRRDAVVRAIEEAMPSTVNISTETVLEIQDPLDAWLREYFGYGRRAPNAQKSLGSGVIIDESGYILTNFHVVRRATRITVTLWDGREFEARPVVGTERSDVALLKIVARDGEKFRAVKFAADDDLLLGETVLALGNPFGLGGSVTRGILSSKTRAKPGAAAVQKEYLEVEDWLQTDAAINPGNSGGPLINVRAELIGINVAIYREGEGIGFAVPVKRVLETLSEIFSPEAIKQLWFGAHFAGGAGGIVTTEVEAGSPAQQAGFLTGDRVLRINEVVPKTIMDLKRELIAADAGKDMEFTVQRGRDRKNLTVRMIPEKEFFNAALIRQRLGATLQEMTQDLAARMGLNATAGLLIAGVDRTGPAAEAELRRGYVVQAINGQVPQDLTQAARQLHAIQSGGRVELSVLIPQQRGRFLRLFQTTVGLSLR